MESPSAGKGRCDDRRRDHLSGAGSDREAWAVAWGLGPPSSAQPARVVGGANPYRYSTACGAHLFLSADSNDVRLALSAGCAAATVPPAGSSDRGMDDGQVRIVFDAEMFFDNQEVHCDAARVQVATGHVLHGVTNQAERAGT